MRIIPVSFDSMGVHGMGTFVTAGRFSIFIDPGAGVTGRRFGLSPSNLELMTLDATKRKIYNLMRDSDIITVSHYHHHHYIPPQDIHASEVYRRKIVLCKDRRSKCNFVQRKRGKDFELFVRNISAHFKFADGIKESFENVTIKFSEPVPHGLVEKDQGYLLMVSIEDGTKKLVHCSDVAGPTERRTAEIIVFEKPDIIILCGPPTHEWYLSKMILDKAKSNMEYIIEKSGAKEIILDHHSMRDMDYKKNLVDIYAFAEQLGVKITSAAEFAGQPIRQLEAKRNQLWEREQTEQNY